MPSVRQLGGDCCPHVCVGACGRRSLLRGVMLIRSKQAVAEQLALAPCTFIDREVELSVTERTFYGAALSERARPQCT